MLSLLDSLKESLKGVPGSHDYDIQVVRSQPRRAHALFPYSHAKIWQEEVLVVLSEAVALGTDDQKKGSIPIIAIEAGLYTIPSTSTSLVYISKVDSTGLALPGSATRALTSAFLQYHLENPPHNTRRVRIHIFARAQGQYLFPGSVDNKGKRVLDDKGLLKWWKATISKAALSDVQLHYLVPGLAQIEAMAYVPSSSASSSSCPEWSYGHPYNKLTSPVHTEKNSGQAKWFEHIPSFPDDPKARFVHSLTSSVVEAAGQEGDYDDIMLQLLSSTFTTGSSTSAKLAQVEKDKEKERQRLIDGVPGGIEEFWERMSFRQECASGVLVGFFVVVRDLPPPDSEQSSRQTLEPLTPPRSQSTNTATDSPAGNSKQHNHSHHPSPYEGALGHSRFTALWSSFHNVDYAATEPDSLARIAERALKWSQDVERAVHASAFVSREPEVEERKRVYDELTFASIRVDNPIMTESQKNGGENKRATIVVNKMVPRKKVKKA